MIKIQKFESLIRRLNSFH